MALHPLIDILLDMENCKYADGFTLHFAKCYNLSLHCLSRGLSLWWKNFTIWRVRRDELGHPLVTLCRHIFFEHPFNVSRIFSSSIPGVTKTHKYWELLRKVIGFNSCCSSAWLSCSLVCFWVWSAIPCLLGKGGTSNQQFQLRKPGIVARHFKIVTLRNTSKQLNEFTPTLPTPPSIGSCVWTLVFPNWWC